MNFLWDRIVELDQAIHDRIMNPVFKFIQKQLHWNRFDLIRVTQWMMLLTMTISIVIVIALGVSHKIYWVIVLMVVIALPSLLLTSLQSYFLYWPELKKASRAFEEKSRTVLSKDLLERSRTSMKRRPIEFMWVLVIVVPHLFSTSSYDMLTLMVDSWICIIWIECHLWDVEDVDPKDREYLFDPETANDRV